MANSPITTGQDVVDYLKAQHETIRQAFTATLDAADAETRQEAFTRLRTLLAVHETAEEMMVHPRVRRKVQDGSVDVQAVVDARLAEEHESKVALSELEGLDINSAEFGKALISLQGAVLEHAEKEETEEFPLLTDNLDAEELQRMAVAVQVAERIAPTHPHPGVESAAANFAVGPFASLLDRARDAFRAA
ncbi:MULTISPECIES: hemerythrin domain-containing protein [Mycobacteriaceae]|uniref:hemerythrin domain-containing protein n=1 Tax=Mycobacteriaceae TaxID=1762 RepID=UPI0007FC0269|nr:MULTISPECIES: hemerythrin domain-containing protein [Mycobacteriaceae]MCK0174995.1 hemerythrin domain-containing protein [Mycolicibacterium sp. F2034L]OBB61368.1 hemerythrin [Mycobacterium sp. 852013-51886_SCH5428379]